MNDTAPLHPEALRDAIDLFNDQTPGVKLTLEGGGDQGFLLEVRTPAVTRLYEVVGGDGKVTRYNLIWPRREVPLGNPDRVLFFRKLPTQTAKRLLGAGQAYLDGAGNALFVGPNLYVQTVGRRQPQPTDRTHTRINATGNPAEIRATFTFLCQPGLLNRPQREIAEAAGIALGAVGYVIKDLAERGLIFEQTITAHQRQIRDYPRMVKEWAFNYTRKLRPKLNPQRFRSGDDAWWGDADIVKAGGAWGGEVAADQYTHYLHPTKATIYVDPQPNARAKIVQSYRLRPDPAGDIEVIDRFWTFPNDAVKDTPQYLVPWPLVYADLVATLDPRNLETAELLIARAPPKYALT